MGVDILEFYSWPGFLQLRGTPSSRGRRVLSLLKVEFRLRIRVKVIHLVVHGEDDILTVPGQTYVKSSIKYVCYCDG